MPAKTIYVKDSDLNVVERAQKEFDKSISQLFIESIKERLDRRLFELSTDKEVVATPQPSDDFLAMISAFSLLDLDLTLALVVMSQMPYDSAFDLFSGLTFSQKVDQFTAFVLHHLGKQPGLQPKFDNASISRLQNDLKILGNERNAIVHGMWRPRSKKHNPQGYTAHVKQDRARLSRLAHSLMLTRTTVLSIVTAFIAVQEGT